MKRLLKVLTVVFLLGLYIYTYNIAFIPNSVILFEGEELRLKTALGLSISKLYRYETAQTSSKINNQSISNKPTNNQKAKLSLFGNINIKTVNVNIIPKTKVVPIGTTIGMKLYTNGVLVVGMSEIKVKENKMEKPYENTDIEEGDSIIAINNKEINNTDDLIEEIHKSGGSEIKIKYQKENEILESNIQPTKVEDDYKIGLWVRDATAGVGTLTFYEPSTNMFMSLGHGIEDIDTGKIVEISNGELITASVKSIVKGEKDSPRRNKR